MFEFGEWLKSTRADLNLTQLDIAESVGVSVMSVHKYESNKTDPTYITMMSIIDALGYEIEIKKKGA